jgi:hypothetical protein
MTLRTFELRERRDRFRSEIPVGIVGNSRQAGIDTALHPPQQFTHTRAMRHLIEGVEGFQQQRFRDHRPVRRLPVIPVEQLKHVCRTNSAADAAVAGFF